MLFQWGRWYKGIFELPPHEKPDDDILEDDTKIDRWYESYQRETMRKMQGKTFKNSDDMFKSVPQWRENAPGQTTDQTA